MVKDLLQPFEEYVGKDGAKSWSLQLTYLIHYTDQIAINEESIPEARFRDLDGRLSLTT